MTTHKRLYATYFDSPLGQMVALADEQHLQLLDFTDCFKEQAGVLIAKGESAPLLSIKEELKRYFAGELRHFKTAVAFAASPFRERVWKQLQKIPAGETRSYQQLATAIGQPLACRAVGSANGKNGLSIIVPCHRVINANGSLGGYAGGIARKKWLLEHERCYRSEREVL